MFALEGRLVVMAGLVCPPALLHGRVPFAVRKEVGGFSSSCPLSHQLRGTSPPHIPALPSHTQGPCSATQAGMGRSGETQPAVTCPQPGSC